MHRRLFLLNVVGFPLATMGCGSSKKTPDQMNQAEFEAWLAGQLGVTDLFLTEDSEGKFTGSAKKGGQPYTISVTRDTNGITWQARGPNEILRGGVKK